MRDTIIIADELIDGVGPEPRRDVAAVVRDDRIQAVVSLGSLSPTMRKDAEVIEAPGHTLMPGLIDCHTHLVFHQYPTLQRIDQDSVERATIRAARTAEILVDHGYTTVRDVASRGAASISVGRAVREGRLRGPRVLACGPMISTTAGTSDSYPPWIRNSAGLGAVVDGTREIQAEVRRQAKLGATHVKLGLSGSEPSVFCFTWMTTMSQEEVSAAVTEAHRLRLRVACHSEAETSSLYAARAGADTIEHGTRLTEETAYLMRDKGIHLVPTLCTVYSVLELGETLGLSQKQRDEMDVNRGPWLASLKLARDAGVKIAAGGDIGNRYRHGENAKEILLLAENGFTLMEALQAATSVAADAVGLGDRVGRLAPGYSADLVLIDGHPLRDLKVLLDPARIARVMVAGRWQKGRTRSPDLADNPMAGSPTHGGGHDA
jgi:imidazolonepropionase-like amidohydrolase